jgi:hypothetical protein
VFCVDAVRVSTGATLFSDMCAPTSLLRTTLVRLLRCSDGVVVTSCGLALSGFGIGIAYSGQLGGGGPADERWDGVFRADDSRGVIREALISRT